MKVWGFVKKVPTSFHRASKLESPKRRFFGRINVLRLDVIKTWMCKNKLYMYAES